jgi:catechol-2,3-dioxygenase
MARPPDAQLTHIGLYVRDMAAMTEFYAGLLGLVVTDAGPYRDGSITFMSRNPDEHHQLVLVSGRRAEDTYSPVGQISFRVKTLEDVQYFHAAASERGLRDLRSSDHGNAWSISFLDAEGNRIEVYAPSPWYVSQPCQGPLDLALPAAEIRDRTQRMVEAKTTFQPADAWRAAMRGRMA